MPFPSTSILDAFTRANEGPPPSASWNNAAGTGYSEKTLRHVREIKEAAAQEPGR